MKRIITSVAALLFAASVWAQSPQKMSYQAVVRDGSSKLITNHAVGMRISILQGSATGTAVYTETQTPQTNENGLVSIEIGKEVSFATIDWSTGVYFIKTEIDPAGGVNYSIIGTSQLLSVPYAQYAQKAGNATDGSETKLKAGTNVSVTGTGTTASPYVVNATSSGGTSSSLPQYTQAQIDALTPQSGMLVYNTDYSTLQYYNGIQWIGNKTLNCEPKPNYAIAGKDTVITATTLNLYANAPNTGVKGYWQIIDGAGGVIVDVTNPNSIFIGKVNMVYVLRWSLYTSCEPNTDEIAITIIPDKKTIKTGLIIDRDGNSYKTVTLGDQTWMAENLKVTQYNDGTAIPVAPNNTPYYELPGTLFDYENSASNSIKYGKLYNWYAVMTGKLCPTGWHVPTYNEWLILKNYLILAGYNYDDSKRGDKIAKSLASTTDWNLTTEVGGVGNTDYSVKRNATGFTALPGGKKQYDYFGGIGQASYWWSFTEQSKGFSYYTRITNGENKFTIEDRALHSDGLSVRCLKD